jgi:hypothetical protein
LLRLVVLLRARRGAYEEKEVIRVSNGEHDRPTEAAVAMSGLVCPSLRRRSVASRRRWSALQDVSRVSLLDEAESNVREQRRENPALRRAGVAAEERALRENAGLEESDDQAVRLRVRDPPAHPLHQTVMVDVVEASLDVSLDDPLVREPTLRARLDGLGTKEQSKVLQRPVDRLAGPEAVRDGEEIRLEHGLQDVLECCLNDPILHRGNPQGAKLPWRAEFRDEHPPHRRWPVRAGAKLRTQLCDECFCPFRHMSHRDAVHAGRSAAAVARDTREGHP